MLTSKAYQDWWPYAFNSHERIAEGVTNDETSEPVEMRDARTQPTVFSGGAGMVSTAGAYARFLQMLFNGGEAKQA